MPTRPCLQVSGLFMLKTTLPRTYEDGLLSVIVPAHDEEDYIGACLDALLEQDDSAGRVEIIVAANACQDGTVAESEARVDRAQARGWGLTCLSIPKPGKLEALNRAEAAMAGQGPRVFLDADVVCEPDLLGQLRGALDTDRPLYATGTLSVAPPRTYATRAYARVWTRLPFVTGGAVGAGLFAVNPAGRARWNTFPNIISDDTYVRLHFAPHERVEVPARYHWPMVEGIGNLIRVRRRQDAGVREIAGYWPDLIANEGKASPSRALLARIAAADPIGLGVYLWVHGATRLKSSGSEWTRGR